jgi:hypothetical protein
MTSRVGGVAVFVSAAYPNGVVFLPVRRDSSCIPLSLKNNPNLNSAQDLRVRKKAVAEMIAIITLKRTDI